MLHATLLGWDGALWSALPALVRWKIRFIRLGRACQRLWESVERVVLVVASAEEHDLIEQVHGQITSL